MGRILSVTSQKFTTNFVRTLKLHTVLPFAPHSPVPICQQPVNIFAYAFNDVAINLNQGLLIIASIKTESGQWEVGGALELFEKLPFGLQATPLSPVRRPAANVDTAATATCRVRR